MEQKPPDQSPGAGPTGDETRPPPLDVVPPARIAQLVEGVGVRKARLDVFPTLVLGILAGAFIAFGGMFYTLAITGAEAGFGPTRLIGGLAFSLGLILVIIGGAELFTGNSLVLMSWLERHIGFGRLARNWALVYAGNFLGALGTVVLLHLSGVMTLADGQVGVTARVIAETKGALDPLQAFVRGILCNVLVCLAVWMCFAAHTVTGKVLVIVFPITAFVALGFEHSVANMYLMPIGALQTGSTLEIGDMFANLLFVTAGNIVGGGVFVALVYWAIYLRTPPG